MSDLIDRQAAIDALGEEPMVWTDSDYEIAQRNQWNVDKLAIETVPPAQTDVLDTNVGDMISRQDAVSRFSDLLMLDLKGQRIPTWEEVYNAMQDLPSAQPESLTDKEQRIFLAAMGREEKVCKQVDDECRDCREPYEDSLVKTCHEITRKVKGALWTI